MVADSTRIRLSPEAAAHFRDAIRSARSALLALEPIPPGPAQLVIGRLVSWWTRAITVAEPIVVASLTEEP